MILLLSKEEALKDVSNEDALAGSLSHTVQMFIS